MENTISKVVDVTIEMSRRLLNKNILDQELGKLELNDVRRLYDDLSKETPVPYSEMVIAFPVILHEQTALFMYQLGHPALVLTVNDHETFCMNMSANPIEFALKLIELGESYGVATTTIPMPSDYMYCWEISNLDRAYQLLDDCNDAFRVSELRGLIMVQEQPITDPGQTDNDEVIDHTFTLNTDNLSGEVVYTTTKNRLNEGTIGVIQYRPLTNDTLLAYRIKGNSRKLKSAALKINHINEYVANRFLSEDNSLKLALNILSVSNKKCFKYINELMNMPVDTEVMHMILNMLNSKLVKKVGKKKFLKASIKALRASDVTLTPVKSSKKKHKFDRSMKVKPTCCKTMD